MVLQYVQVFNLKKNNNKYFNNLKPLKITNILNSTKILKIISCLKNANINIKKIKFL